MPFHQRTMPNGLQIVAETNPNALCVGLAFWVKTGSRDETADLAGVSHFLEHMVFKGTNRRDSFQVNRDFSRIGADNNAFTSEENTVFHATFLPEFLPEAVDVLADILRPALRTEDFTTEKKVILDEIVRYEVQPAWATVENGRKIYFGDHPSSTRRKRTVKGNQHPGREPSSAHIPELLCPAAWAISGCPQSPLSHDGRFALRFLMANGNNLDRSWQRTGPNRSFPQRQR